MNYIATLDRDNFPIYKRKTYIREGKEGDDFLYRTIVTLKGLDGVKYQGIADISREDTKYYSRLAGFQIAERRAYIAYIKNRIESLKFTKKMYQRMLKWEIFKNNLSNNDIRRFKYKIGELNKGIKEARKILTFNYKKIDNIVNDVWAVKDKIARKLGQKTEN